MLTRHLQEKIYLALLGFELLALQNNSVNRPLVLGERVKGLWSPDLSGQIGIQAQKLSQN
jgi:hypothetical protein